MTRSAPIRRSPTERRRTRSGGVFAMSRGGTSSHPRASRRILNRPARASQTATRRARFARQAAARLLPISNVTNSNSHFQDHLAYNLRQYYRICRIILNLVIVVDRDNESIPCTGGRLSPAAENAAREDTRPPGEFTMSNTIILIILSKKHQKLPSFTFLCEARAAGFHLSTFHLFNRHWQHSSPI